MKQLSASLLRKFNQPDTVLVISKYPYQNHSRSYHGVACYTQNLLQELSQKKDKRFVVLVQQEYDRPIEFDLESKNILIIPAFDRGVKMFVQLLSWVTTFRRLKTIHVHSEFYTSGELIQMAGVIPFLTILKMLGKEVIYTAHNVITDYSFIASHLGKKQSDTTLTLIQKLTPLYYALLSQAISRFVVLDHSIKERIAPFIEESKIWVSPIWVKPNTFTTQSRRYWRKKYNFAKDDLVVMCTGFMTKYKGVDWLVDTIEHLHLQHQDKKIKLVLAGGKAASQAGKAHYETFYNDLAEKIATNPNMVLTGFVPARQVKNYFALADIVVLPYRGILGASASWADALTYGKPFILSEELSSYLSDPDIQVIMAKLGIAKEDIIFIRKKNSFATHLSQLVSGNKLELLQKLSQEIALSRTPEKRIEVDLSLYTPQPGIFSLQLNSAFSLVKKLATQ